MSIGTKFGRIVTYCKRLSTLKSHDSSSNIVEVIWAVLNFLFLFFIYLFFFMIRFRKHKKAQKSTNPLTANKNKKIRMKNI